MVRRRRSEVTASVFACYLNEKFKIERQNEGRGNFFPSFRVLAEWASNLILSRTG
jgi:hypothetical protein